MFRRLKPNEIECRIGTVSKDGKGMSLLLYKDARCDMSILDETVGAFNWKREHAEYKGNLYCGVSIKNPDNGEWVTKWDCGSESRTEAEKGESSDSFKRACVNWGIGRELYSSPFIWVKGYDKYEKFSVSDIGYDELGKICSLTILDKSGIVAYSFGSKSRKNGIESYISNDEINEIKALISSTGTDESAFLKYFKVTSIDKMPKDKASIAIKMLKTKGANNG